MEFPDLQHPGFALLNVTSDKNNAAQSKTSRKTNVMALWTKCWSPGTAGTTHLQMERTSLRSDTVFVLIDRMYLSLVYYRCYMILLYIHIAKLGWRVLWQTLWQTSANLGRERCVAIRFLWAGAVAKMWADGRIWTSCVSKFMRTQCLSASAWTRRALGSWKPQFWAC